MPCGFDLNRTHKALPLTQRPEWQNLRAAQSGRVISLMATRTLQSSRQRLVDSEEILAELLHPEIFEYGYREPVGNL